MLGKIAAAMIGEHMAGKDKRASGAIKGILIETVAKKVIPAIAAAAILGYAYKKAKNLYDEEFGGEEPDYSSEASPSA